MPHQQRRQRVFESFSDGFSPASIGGLVLWIDSSYGIALNGATIAGIEDRSPMGWDLSQSTAGRQPTQGEIFNRPALGCLNASQSYLGSSTFNSLSGKSQMTVFQIVEKGVSSLNGLTTFATPQFIIQSNQTPNQQIFLLTSGAYVGCETDNDGAQITEVTWDGTRTDGATIAERADNRVSHYRNGIKLVNTLLGAGEFPTVHSATPGIGIGNADAFGFATLGYTGDIDGTLVYNRLLTPSERSRVRMWLAQRYGIPGVTP